MFLNGVSGTFHPISQAVQAGDWDIVDTYVLAGFPVEAVDGMGATLLYYAAGGGRRPSPLSSMQLLLDKGAPVSVQDPSGHTPLHIAAMLGTAEACTALCAAGGDVNTLNNYGDSVLVFLCKNCNPEHSPPGREGASAVDKARVLLGQPALDLGSTSGGLTAEQWARSKGRDDIADMVAMEVGWPINAG